jgi:hypothetical protein
MVFISFLLMFNNIINIIFYSYYKYNNKFIVNDEEKLYVYETYTYKLFISMLKDNLENYNNLYFTQNTSSNLLKIFIIFTIVFFWLLIISDTYLVILAIIENPDNIIYLIVIFMLIVFIIYYSLLFIINYRDLLIVSVSLWLVVVFVSSVVIYVANKKNDKNVKLISIIFLFSTFFVPDDSNEDKDDSNEDKDDSNEDKVDKFKTIFYYTILISVFIIFVLLILSFTIFEGKNATTISYEKYCFDINDNKYNSLENYFHNKYFKDMDYKYLEEIKEKLEEHNIYTINKIIKFQVEHDLYGRSTNESYTKLDAFIDEIIKISKILKSSDNDYDKYDKLDFVKLVNIFINNELIYMNRFYGNKHVNENDLHKDFNYLFNMNEKVVNKETYNIENVLIAAFPVKYINKNVTIE